MTHADAADSWTVHITDDDVRAARAAWGRALGASDARRADVLYDDLRRLIGAQAQQMAEHFRAAGGRWDDASYC
jgi:hypothetical protein